MHVLMNTELHENCHCGIEQEKTEIINYQGELCGKILHLY
jgi:hypothetical protein